MYTKYSLEMEKASIPSRTTGPAMAPAVTADIYAQMAAVRPVRKRTGRRSPTNTSLWRIESRYLV
jgi:hypothetical protein